MFIIFVLDVGFGIEEEINGVTHLAQFISKKANVYSFDLQFSMDNYRGLIQDMSPQDREVRV